MVQKFEYKRATMEDIDELVRTRIIVLRAANKLSDDEDMSVVEEESKAYYWTFMKMFLVAFWCHMLMDLGRRVREMTLRRRFEFLKLM